jgi:tetratricopeptide (TPR) repeat protein
MRVCLALLGALCYKGKHNSQFWFQEGKMNKEITGKVVVLAFFLAASFPLFGQTAADYISQGDAYYAQFDDAKALDEYLLAVKAEPANYEALWKTARAYFDVGDLVDPKEPNAAEKQKKLYLESESYAKQAIKANPEDTWGHFYVSAAMGKHALLMGKKEQINMSRQIKAEIEKAIALDPNNDLAWHALGRWNRRMAEIGGAKRFFGGIIYGSIPKGSFEEAVKDFQKAIELNPNYTNHHLELGLTYETMKKYDLAAQEFQKCIDCPITTSKCHIFKQQAQEELDKLKTKKK